MSDGLSPLLVVKNYNLSPLPSMTRTTINKNPHQTPSPPLSSEGHHPLPFHLSCIPYQHHNHGTAWLIREMTITATGISEAHQCAIFATSDQGILARVSQDYHFALEGLLILFSITTPMFVSMPLFSSLRSNEMIQGCTSTLRTFKTSCTPGWMSATF